MRVGYAGEPGAFGEQAARAVGDEVETVGFAGFRELAAAVAGGAVGSGVIPIENRIAGAVTSAIAALIEHRPGVCGEVRVRVEHLLLGVPGGSLEDVRTVTSHPQALAQCRRFITARGWQTRPDTNTAVAARHVREARDPHLAAIASRAAADALGLEILAEGIADEPVNVTRFYVLSGAALRDPGCGYVGAAFQPRPPGSIESRSEDRSYMPGSPTESRSEDRSHRSRLSSGETDRSGSRSGVHVFIRPSGSGALPEHARRIGSCEQGELLELDAALPALPAGWIPLGTFIRAPEPGRPGQACASAFTSS